MNVLKHGNRIKILTCSFCGCEMEASMEDTILLPNYSRIVHCPECGTTIYYRNYPEEIKSITEMMKKKERKNHD